MGKLPAFSPPGKIGFKEREKCILPKGEATANESGRQEFLENLINEFI